MAANRSEATPDRPGRGGIVPRRLTRLRVARLVGATAVGVLGQVAVHDPTGFFGSRDQITHVGWIYFGVVGLMTAVEGFGQFLGRGRASVLSPLILSITAGIFVPAFAVDPVTSGVVILWQLVVLAHHFLDRPAREQRAGLVEHLAPDRPPERWLLGYGPATRHLLGVALVAWLAIVGFELTHHWVARAACLLLDVLAVLPASRFLVLLWRSGRRGAAAAWLPLLAAAATAATPTVALSFVALHVVLALAILLVYSPTFTEILSHFYERPALFVAYTFAAMILLGTLLLTFPAASAGPEPIAPLDAFFTSTSAVCVTGLIVRDTPVAFSPFGQGVILALIQIGGLGIMVLSTFAALLLGGRMGLRRQQALGEHLELAGAGSALRLVMFIVRATLLLEAAGALALLGPFSRTSPSFGVACWRAVFHAVSAFCNAGFALQSDSMVGFQRDPAALLVVAALITLGGLGFVVLSTAWSRARGRGPRRLPVQVRVVAWASLFLIVVGSGVYLAVEWNASLAGLPVGHKIVNAVFQSVTLRTAGFNSVDLSLLRTPTILMMIVWMFVGASPGGTGGGIKTTTATLLLAAVPSIARGETRVSLFGRTIPQVVIYRCAAIFVVTLFTALAGLFVLTLTHPQSLEVLLFEVTSAVGTVGLSLGATAALAPLGKYVVVLLMFIGRVGPLTLALTMGRTAPRRTVFPEEGIAVG
jgi:trk/ktr system potassium uptake protein